MNLGTLISKITNGRRERLTSPVPHRRRIDYRRVLERSFASHRYSIIWSARASTVGGTKRLARKESRNETLWNIGSELLSLRLDVGRDNHLAPLPDFVCD